MAQQVTIAQLQPLIQQEAMRAGVDPSMVTSFFQQDAAAGGGFIAFENDNSKVEAIRSVAAQLKANSANPSTSSHTATSTRSKVLPADVQTNLLNSASQATAARGGLMSLLTALTGQSQVAAEGVKTATGEMAAAAGQQATASAEQVAATYDLKQKIKTAMGLDIENPDSAMSKDLSIIVNAEDTIRNLRPAVDAAQAANPLTDVFGWLKGQVDLMTLAPKYNAAVVAQKTAQENIDARKRNANGMEQFGSAAQVQAAKDEANAKAVQAAAQARRDSAKVDMEMVGQRMSVARIAAQLGEEEFKQNTQLASILAVWQQEAERSGASAAEAKTFENIQKARIAAGMPPLSSVTEMKAMSTKEKTALLSMLDENGNFRSLGQGMASIEELGSKSSLALTRPAQVEWLNVAHKAALPELQKASLDPTNAKKDSRELAAEVIDKMATSWVRGAAEREYDKLGAGNPYRIMAGLAARSPALENNPLAQYVKELKPSQAGQVTEKELFAYTIAQLENKKINLDQATKQLTDFFREGYRHQWEQLDAAKFGFNINNPKSKEVEYPVSSFGLYESTVADWINMGNKGTGGVQLMNDASVRNALVRELTGRAKSGVYQPAIQALGQQ